MSIATNPFQAIVCWPFQCGVSFVGPSCYLCFVLAFVMPPCLLLIDISLTVKAATLIFISGRGSAISSAKEGKSGFIYNLLKSYKLFVPQTCVHFMKILTV